MNKKIDVFDSGIGRLTTLEENNLLSNNKAKGNVEFIQIN